MIKKVLLPLFFSAICFLSRAQEIVIDSFELDPTDLSAKVQPQYDINGDPCALIKVNIASSDVSYSGNIVGTPLIASGSHEIYMASGSDQLFISVKGYKQKVFQFANRLEPFRVYNLSITLPPIEKIRSLIQPSLSLGITNPHTSYGLMIGFARKFGGYVRVKSDFNFSLKTSGEYDDKGQSEEWVTGNTQKRRHSITAGGIARVYKPLYLYLGGGYGTRIRACEVYDGSYYSIKSDSFSGFEAETGFLLRFGFFALSAGVQTNHFKYVEGNVGVGFMF